MSQAFDTLIRGGRVIDPANEIDAVMDVAIRDGRIVSIAPSIRPMPTLRFDASDGRGRVCGPTVIDARDKLIVPGLIDFHAHVYKGLSTYGMDPDRVGIQSGVTHINDVGSTGWMIYSGFRDLVAARATTPTTTFPNIVGLGIPENWGYLGADLKEVLAATIRSDCLIDVAERNKDSIKGVKVHVDRGLCSQLDTGWEALEAARRVTDACKINLYVHLGDLWPVHPSGRVPDVDHLLTGLVRRMREGEVVGHCFTPWEGGFVSTDNNVRAAAFDASGKGLMFEVGHGINFSFTRARAFLDAGLTPDIVSSDIHATIVHSGRPLPNYGLEPDREGKGVSWTMVGTMTKMLALQIPLADVVRMSTINPARAIGIADTKGTLGVGRAADITVLDRIEGDFVLMDTLGESVAVNQLLIPTHTILAGKVYDLDVLALPEFHNEYIESEARWCTRTRHAESEQGEEGPAFVEATRCTGRAGRWPGALQGGRARLRVRPRTAVATAAVR